MISGVVLVISIFILFFICLGNVVIFIFIVIDGNGCSFVCLSCWSVLVFGEVYFVGGFYVLINGVYLFVF